MNLRNILILFLALQSFSSIAQYTPQEEATQLFESGHYSEALPIYKRLVTLFPKDPRYQYYYGICLVQTNNDLIKAIDYLKVASEKSVPRDVYFFLGKAYHYQYRFDEALDAYLKFQQFGERPEKEKWQCDMHIAMARNGKRLTEKQAQIEVYKVDSVSPNQLFSYYNGLLKSGKFQEKSTKNIFGSDSKPGNSWRFMPSFVTKGQGVFESSFGTFKKNKDLVVVKKLDDDNWSRPENLGAVINSQFDEDYAYFNPAESALYFASKGHNSMGGYDIFKSIYNPDTKSWSEPINLGYPINSPYDDFLFVPSDDQNVAYFTSNRESQKDKFMVYSISFSQQYSFTSIPKGFNLISQSHLIAVSTKPVRRIANSGSSAKQKPDSQAKLLKEPEAPKQVITKSYPVELIEHKEYNEVLNAALLYQLQSDSLGRVAESVRTNMQASKSETEKNKLKREIYLLEQRSKTAQQKADELYDKARAYEMAYATGKQGPKENEPQVTKEMVKNAFSQKDSDNPSANSKRKGKEKTSKSGKEVVVQPVKPIIYEFKIMAKAPYKSINEIPINQPLPGGLLYRIQMGAFSKTIEPDRFKGLIPISGETVQNGQVTKYYAGIFSRMDDAEKALNKIREYGFKDAYIVSFFNGKSIPINRAKELENDN
jgi:hypothetical protein